MHYKYIIILIKLLFVSHLFSQSVDLEQDLALKLVFDGNANDQSGNNIPTNVIGPILTEDRFGNPNQAYSFDGIDDRIELNNNNPVITSDAFSVCMWAKTIGQSHSASKQNALFEQRDDESTLANAKSSIVFYSETQSLTRITIRGSIPGEEPITIDCESQDYNEWHHYTFVFHSNNSVNLYVDAVFQVSGTFTGSGNFTTSIDHVDIGTHQYRNTIKGAFYGIIDDVYIYNRAINECEIGVLYGLEMQER